MEELHLQQMNNEVEFIPANNLETITDPYFKEDYGIKDGSEGYQIKKYNSHLYHIAMEKREFKTIGGLPKKVSNSAVVKFTEEDFRVATAKTSMTFAGYVTHLLHIPTSKSGKKPITNIENGISSDKDSGDEITLEGINSITSLKDAKDLYKSVSEKDAGKNWSLEKTKQEIINFLGLESEVGEGE
jgi:hypothetical protein